MIHWRCFHNGPLPNGRGSVNNGRGIGAALVTLAVAVGTGQTARAGPINTDVAFTPREGGAILRLQYHYSESGGAGEVENINASIVRATYVFGVKANLALFLSVPYGNRQIDRLVRRDNRWIRFEEAHDGLADVTVLAKYRFWQHDRSESETQRWAVLGGLNIRSGDSDFSSDSYDPILGTAFSWRRDRGRFDADLVYQFNTGVGDFRHDGLRYDVAYSYRVFPQRYQRGQSYSLDAVAELNGFYSTDGSHEVFLSPGLQYVTERWALEASVQLPVVQEFAQDRPETDFRIVLGFRLHW